MPRPLDANERHKWRGYLSEIESQAERIPLTEEIIKRYVVAWKGNLLDPENPRMRAAILDVSDKVVVLPPGGKPHSVSFTEIINAEKVIRYWLAKGNAPNTVDFRKPDEAIKVPSISNRSYAPPWLNVFAERSAMLQQSR